MMKTYAIIEGDVVTNIVEWTGKSASWQPPEGTRVQLVPEGVSVCIGWTYDSKTGFAAPPAPPAPQAIVPSRVTMRQARLALRADGKLAAVGTAIKALPSPQKEDAQIEWDYATTVERSSPVVALLSAALGLDDAALDALFTAAAVL